MEEVEKRISDLEYNTEQLKTQVKLEKFKNTQEWNNQEMWDTMKRSNPCIIGVEEEESQENSIDHIFNRIIDENFPKVKKRQPIQIQEAHRTPNRKETPHAIS